MAKAKVAADRPENAGVLRYIDETGSGGADHPDVVDYVKGLVAKVGGCDVVSVRRTRLLVHRSTGVVVGCVSGTGYFLRVAGVPKGAGVQWSVRWSDGERLNVRKAFGPGWIVGGFDKREVEWLRAAMAALESDA